MINKIMSICVQMPHRSAVSAASVHFARPF